MFMLKVKRFFILVLFWICVGAMGFGIFMAGRYLYPTTIYTKQEVIKEVDSRAPVLERIAKCESKNSHFATNGQVLVAGNTNKSVDIGRYQINSQIWGAHATEQGLNLFIEKDNEKMAIWIYKNYGTEPWVYSKKCWN